MRQALQTFPMGQAVLQFDILSGKAKVLKNDLYPIHQLLPVQLLSETPLNHNSQEILKRDVEKEEVAYFVGWPSEPVCQESGATA